MQLCNMAELRKRKWNSHCCATLWQGNLHKVAAPYFCFMYIVQLYTEDWEILLMLGCRDVALPITDQIALERGEIVLYKFKTVHVNFSTL